MPIELVELGMDKWEHFLVKGDYSCAGTEENAERLLAEYQGLIKCNKMSVLLEAVKNVEFYKTRIKVTQDLIDLLKLGFNERVAAMLREWFDSFPITEETYLSNMEGIVAEAQMYIYEYERHCEDRRKLLGIKEGEEETEQDGFAYYASIKNEIGKMWGTFVPDNINVLRFVSGYNELLNLKDNPKDA